MDTIISKIPERKGFLKGEQTLEIGYPWLSFGAILFLEEIVNKTQKVLEFGSGGSTVFFARNCGSIKSFETNKEWFKKVEEKVKDTENAQIYCSSKNDIYNLLEQEIDNSYDIVLVDSYPKDVERIVLANMALSKVKHGGYLIVDNYLKFGMEDFKYPDSEIFTFDQLRYSGKGTRICRLK